MEMHKEIKQKKLCTKKLLYQKMLKSIFFKQSQTRAGLQEKELLLISEAQKANWGKNDMKHISHELRADAYIH